jgi:hypothetical protein
VLWLAGVILAYSNSLAGYLADLTMQQGLGNIGCFFGGATGAHTCRVHAQQQWLTHWFLMNCRLRSLVPELQTFCWYWLCFI